jgi:hypothetical protein
MDTTQRAAFEACWRPRLSSIFTGAFAEEVALEVWQASRKQMAEEAMAAAGKELDRCGTHLYPDDKRYVLDAIRRLSTPEGGL